MILSSFNKICTWSFIKSSVIFKKNEKLILFATVFTILSLNLEVNANAQGFAEGYNHERYGEVCKGLLDVLGGHLGAMLASIAGVGALVAAAMGGFKMAWSLVVVSLGSFILKEYTDIWFKNCGIDAENFLPISR